MSDLGDFISPNDAEIEDVPGFLAVTTALSSIVTISSADDFQVTLLVMSTPVRPSL